MRKHNTVFLFDVDNTLLDNDRILQNLRDYLTTRVGSDCQKDYWEILEELRSELGYVDYLGSLQRYRVAHPREENILSISPYLIDYPFANRLYPGSLDAIEHVQQWGPAVILSDGDAVFQPWKVHRSGLAEAVRGNILIYIHKEQMLDEVERHFPAEHYVMIDDKLRILDAIKKQWKSRVTTVFVEQGHYAKDPETLKRYPHGDVKVKAIGKVADLPLSPFLEPGRASQIP
ncbi:MAG: HAD family hydrolase [Acidobacteriaceae bacterium]